MIAISSLISCSDKANRVENNNVFVIEAPLKKEARTDLPLISKLSESIDTIYLDSSRPESLLGKIRNVIIEGDTIFIHSDNFIALFSIDGKFISKFERRGRGRGEYISLFDFDILPSKNELFVFDRDIKKVLIYSYSGNFIREVELSDWPMDFAVLQNGDYLFYYPQSFKKIPRRGLWQTDSLGNTKKQLVAIEDYYKNVTMINNYLVHINSDDIGFMGLEDNDNFYRITTDSIYVTCKMKTDIVMSRKIAKNDDLVEQPLTQYLKVDYLESDRLLTFLVTDLKSKEVRVFLDKRDGSVYRVYNDDIKRFISMDEAIPFFGYCYKGRFISYLMANDIMADENFHKKFFPSIKEDSNPVLLVFNTK